MHNLLAQGELSVRTRLASRDIDVDGCRLGREQIGANTLLRKVDRAISTLIDHQRWHVAGNLHTEIRGVHDIATSDHVIDQNADFLASGNRECGSFAHNLDRAVRAVVDLHTLANISSHFDVVAVVEILNVPFSVYQLNPRLQFRAC